MQQNKVKLTPATMILILLASACLAENDLPEGLMLNLNFERVQTGLALSNAVFPLHVPVEEKRIKTFRYRNGISNVLTFEYEQGLDIPHSSLLNPNGDEWVVSVRALAYSNGIILSQSNDEMGYAIYLKDGIAHAVVKTGAYAITLRENPLAGTTQCLNKWVSIELRIKPKMVIMKLNRKRAAYAPLDTPLVGEKLHIRLGHHKHAPAPLKNRPELAKIGFTGAIKSFKIHRQK